MNMIHMKIINYTCILKLLTFALFTYLNEQKGIRFTPYYLFIVSLQSCMNKLAVQIINHDIVLAGMI